MVEKRGALQDVLKGTNEEIHPEASNVEDAKKDLHRPYVEEQEGYVKGEIQEIERAHESYKTSLTWSVVKEISGRKGSSCGRIRANCPEERIKLCMERFDGLLGQPPVVDDQPVTRVFDTVPIKTGDFITTELREAITSTQGNKATWLDGIPAEVWKLECFSDHLLGVCNRGYHGDISDM